ncbi:MAG: hypothetical protein IJ594_01560, partial [Oscillospiraceae bacterium]|nr:hypothetical protein [Oscillospiraceae bacterium]
AANRVELWLLSSFRASPGTRVALLPEGRRPPLAGITRDGEHGTVTLVGRAAGAELLDALRPLLAREGIPVLRGSAEEGCVSVEVAQAQLLPALALLHGAYLANGTDEG